MTDHDCLPLWHSQKWPPAFNLRGSYAIEHGEGAKRDKEEIWQGVLSTLMDLMECEERRFPNAEMRNMRLSGRSCMPEPA